MLKRHEVQVLRRAGHSVAEVARLTGISERSVVRIEEEAPVESADDGEQRRRRGIGRPSKAEPFREFVVAQVMNEPEILSLEVLRRARLQGYTGGKSALYALIAEVRPKPERPVVRFEGLPGEFSQHDFGQVDIRFIDGTKRRFQFFATRMKYSRWTQVTLVRDQRVESLTRTLVEHFAAIGGVPLVAVFDRPKTVALKWDRRTCEVTEWNPTFAGVVLELGVGVEVCWPRRANQKGSVENLVGWVKGSFFKQRRFLDEEDLRRQLAEWHVEVNTQRPSRATGDVPAERMADERRRLRALRVTPDRLALRYPVQVGPTGYVLHDTQLYSMPPGALGLAGTLYLYRDKVRVVAGRFEALHDRLVGRGAKSDLPEHRAQNLAVVSGRRAKRYLKREHLLALGRPALDYLTELVHRRPQAWAHEVDDLHELLQKHGEVALRSAFERAQAEGVFGAEYVAHFVQHPELEPWSTPPPSPQLELAWPAGGVQAAPGAARSVGEAERSAWTPPRTTRRWWRRQGGSR